MKTATETDYSRFENMDPANVWETFERDTIQNAFVEWARNEAELYWDVSEFIEYHVSWWAGVAAKKATPFSDYDVECLTDALRRYCRDELGDVADRAKLVRDAIRVEIDDAVENLNDMIARELLDATWMDVKRKVGGYDYDGQVFRRCNKAMIDTIAGLIEEMNEF